MYRSKDVGFMEDLKSNVLAVTKGYEKEGRKFALDVLRRHIRLDDLHQYAMKKFPNKAIVFGSGSYEAQMVIATEQELPPDIKGKLEKAWEKMKIPTNAVYYAHLKFVPTKKKQEVRKEIFQRFMHVFAPTVIFAFDGLNITYETNVYSFQESLEELLSKEDGRKALTAAFKKARPLILS